MWAGCRARATVGVRFVADKRGARLGPGPTYLEAYFRGSPILVAQAGQEALALVPLGLVARMALVVNAVLEVVDLVLKAKGVAGQSYAWARS